MDGYRALRGFFRMLVRAFFREVSVSGLENVPADRGGILVSWHPNGLVDPGLILATFPRRVVFGAREGLFKVPLLGAVMRAIGTVPIRRVIDEPGLDPAERKRANERSLGALAAEVSRGSFAALFPEGVSHDEPGLVRLKTGVARLLWMARAETAEGQASPVIVPVGLHYDRKNRFRSRAAVAFHPPLALPADLVDAREETEEEAKARAKRLVALLEETLADVVGATSDWRTFRLVQRARSLVRAERARRAKLELEPSAIGEEARGFRAMRAAWDRWRTDDEKGTDLLARRVRRYDALLRTLELEDHELDRDPSVVKGWLAVLLVLQLAFVYFVLPPFLVIGAIVNLPTALLLRVIAKASAALKKDEATIKVLAGVVLWPLTWIGAGVLTFRLHLELDDVWALPDAPVLAGVVVTLISAIGGMAAMRYLRMARETARAVRVRLTRRARVRAIARLRGDRGRLFDDMTERGLENGVGSELTLTSPARSQSQSQL